MNDKVPTGKAVDRAVDAKPLSTMKRLRIRLSTEIFRASIAWYRFKRRVQPKRLRLLVGSWVVAAGAAVWAATWLEPLIGHLGGKEQIGTLQQLLTSVGGALIGATAIAFALVVFAMQVAVERLPHGLFRRLSSDWRLVAFFLSTFLLAILVAALSLFIDKIGVARTLTIAAVCAASIPLLLLGTYRRVLQVIDPVAQLESVEKRTRGLMERWAKRVSHAAELLENRADKEVIPALRAMYFAANKDWTTEIQSGLRYAINFARRYAERGDHEVVDAGLNAVIRINEAYVRAKGKAFFRSVWPFDIPLANDPFINDTLEHMKQVVHAGLTRGDERQVQATYRSLGHLVAVYANIQYANEAPSKHHSALAAGYLSSLVKDAIGKGTVDDLLTGVRSLGQAADTLTQASDAIAVASLSDGVTQIGFVGIANQDYLPVTQSVVQQLSSMTLSLLQQELTAHDSFALLEVRDDAFLLASKVIEHMSDGSSMSNHRTALSPFFSMIEIDSLPMTLTALVNATSNAPAGDKRAACILEALEQWADSLYEPYRKLLALSLGKNSGSCHDVLGWAAHLTKVFVAASNCKACDERTAAELRKSALWLISSFSFIPLKDAKSASQAERLHVTQRLFEVAEDAFMRNCADISDAAFDMILARSFTAAQFKTGWAPLTAGLKAVIALVSSDVIPQARLLAGIQKQLASTALDPNIRHQAMQRVEEDLAQGGFPHTAFERTLQHVDQAQLAHLLEIVEKVLVPELAAAQTVATQNVGVESYEPGSSASPASTPEA